MKKSEKPLQNIKDSTLNTMFGFFLIILSFILIIDTGYVARTLNFIFHFSIGFLAILILALVILHGCIYVFTGKRIKIKHKVTHYIGFVLACLGISTILTLSMEKGQYALNDFVGHYWDYFKGFYTTIRVPYLFRSECSGISGGFLGHFIVASFNSLGLSLTIAYIISSLLIVSGVVIAFIPLFIKLSKSKAKKVKKSKAIKKDKKDTSHQEISSELEIERPLTRQTNLNEKTNVVKKVSQEKPTRTRDEFYIVKDKSKEIIKNASKVSFDEKDSVNESLESAVIPTISKMVEAKPEEKTEKHITFSESSYNRVGGLQPVRFIREGVSFESHPVDTVNDNSLNRQASLNIGEESDETNHNQTPYVAPALDKKPEQIHFDFEEKVEQKAQVKEDLVAVQPEFSDPIVVKKNDGASQNNQTNTNETPSEPIKEEKPKMVKHKFIEPSLDLLNDYETGAAAEKNEQTAEQRKDMINDIFKTFNVHAECIGYVVGPSVTRYNIGYTETAQFKSVNNLTNDISIRLGGVDARFESIVPGQTYSGLEISNAVVTMVGFKECLQALPDRQKHPLAIPFGKNISGQVIWCDLDKTPHMLISGTTGSGKSIFIHSIVMTLIMRNNPDDLRLVLVDPKRVEMSKYKEMPHLLCPNITEPEEATVCLNKLVDEMERRYQLLEDNYVSDIGQYNELCEEKPELEKMPYYVAILDEYSDLVDRARDIERPVISLAQKARACGIHLIICTQRPSTNVITGLIKGNLPTHVALMTASTTDSITIIGEGGAEKLLGKGDMLVQSPIVSKIGCARLQGCFVQNKEILKVVEFLKSTMTTDYHPDFLDLSGNVDEGPNPMPFEHQGGDNHVKVDEAYEDVKDMIMNEEYASISKIQREFGFGFTRAGRIFNQLVKDGIVERPNQKKGNSTGCRVLVHDSSYGREAEIGSNEVASTETMDEYIKNSDRSGGSY